MTEREHLRKGWCPTLTRPMQTGDGWLVRLCVPFGILTAAQARAIAGLAEHYGNGHLDLTARGNLQIRGVTPEQYEPLYAALARENLAEEPALNILTSPLAGLDPACDPRVHDMARELQTAFEAEPAPLSAKFLCIIDGGGIAPLTGIRADLTLTPADSLQAALEKIRAAGGQRIPTTATPASPPPPGLIIFPETTILALAIPFGRLEHTQLLALANLAARHGDATLRLAPWRSIFLPAVTNAAAALENAHTAGFITTPNDARRAIQTCPGAPACASAQGPTRELAQSVAHAFPSLTRSIHISGCAKGCANPAKSSVTITAQHGTYNLAFDATADATSAHAALTQQAVIATLKQWITT